MAGPGEPFNKGRLVLVFVVLSVLTVGGWLLLRQPEADIPVETVEPLPPEQPIATYLANADATRGERFFFARCAACHSIVQGGSHGVGPNLWGVMGNRIASRADATYSEGLRTRGGTWDWESANAFLRSPRAFQPNTRMTFAGVSKPQDRADVMLYMNREGGSLPAPAGVR